MPSDNAPEQAFEPRAESKRLIRTGRYASLGTLDRKTGAPYVSLVSTATDFDGAPVILISTLAVHTRNLEADPHVAILFAEIGGGDPVAHPRVSVTGVARKVDDERAKRRFLERHCSARVYAGFSDFAFWRIEPAAAHLVAGFGRIVDLSPQDILAPVESAEGLAETEAEAVAHVNEDHADTAGLYATALLGRTAGAWRVTSIDPEGCDLAQGDETARLLFPNVVKTPAELRHAFRVLADKARAKI